MTTITLEKLHEQSDRDLEIKEDQLILESIRTPSLFSKYNKLLTIEKLVLKELEFEFKKAERDSWEYFGGKADPEVYKERPFGHKIMKPDMDRYMDSDPALQKVRTKLILQTEKVEAIERILKEVNQRQWHIRNINETQKFLAGN